MTAEDRGWGPPGCTRSQLMRIDVPGIPLNVRREVAPLFRELVRWLTVERARYGRPPLSSSGGYVKRYVRGSTRTWSNHSWGLAADFNAATNPMQTALRTDMPPGTSAKAASLGMRWGGDYAGRKDPMHFEVMRSPDEVGDLLRDLERVDPPVVVVPLPPRITKGDDMDLLPVLRVGASGQAVRNLQGLLVAAGRRVDVDGDFGPGTERALKEWQAAAKAPGGADGVAGPGTWGRLLGLR